MTQYNEWQLAIWNALKEADGKPINIDHAASEKGFKLENYELGDFFNYLIEKNFIKGRNFSQARITPDGKAHYKEVIGQQLSVKRSTSKIESNSQKLLSRIEVEEEMQKYDLPLNYFTLVENEEGIFISVNSNSKIYFSFEETSTGLFCTYLVPNKSETNNFSASNIDEIISLLSNWLSLIKQELIEKNEIGSTRNIKRNSVNNLPIQFYAVGSYWGDNNDESERFFKDNNWENGYETDYVDIVNEVQQSDILILKATYSGKFRIKGIGIVEKNLLDGHKIAVKWFNPYPNKSVEPDWIDIEGSLGQYQRTIARINSIDHIHQIFSYLKEIGLEVQKVIDLKLAQNVETESIVEIESEPSQDMLGTTDIASIFLQMILSSNLQEESSTENVKSKKEEQFYGIFGQWGRGKTYFWRKVQDLIKEKYSDKLLPVEFHAWKYQDTPATWAYLFEVLASVYYNKPKSLIPKPGKLFKYWIKIIWLNIHRGVLKGFLFFVLSVTSSFLLFSNVSSLDDLIFIFTGSFTAILSIWSFLKILNKSYVSTAKEYLKKITEHVTYTEHLGLQHEIQKEIKYLLKAWLGNSGKKILLFVDDIDRCRENKIIELVDSLRVMMDDTEISNHIVVLAAIDEEILKFAIKSKYKDYDLKGNHLERIVREYIDKLFLAGIKLPTLGGVEKINILKGFLGHKIKKIKETHKTATTIFNNPEESNVKANDSTFSFNFDKRISTIKKIEESYQLTESEYQELNDLILKLNGATPRVIRSFTIKYRLGKNIVSVLIGNNNDLITEWHNDEMKKHFANLLIEEIHRDKKNTNDDFESNSDLSNELTIIIKNSLEMVVPY